MSKKHPLITLSPDCQAMLDRMREIEPLFAIEGALNEEDEAKRVEYCKMLRHIVKEFFPVVKMLAEAGVLYTFNSVGNTINIEISRVFHDHVIWVATEHDPPRRNWRGRRIPDNPKQRRRAIAR
jgi:hypothetical protein